MVLLAGGLIALLMLNTALNQGSFELTKLQKRTTTLTDEQQGLQQQIDRWSAPDALEQRARQLGMVPGNGPAFLQPNGIIQGTTSPLTGPPVPTSSPSAAPSSSPSPSASSASVSASASASPSSSSNPSAASSATASPGDGLIGVR
ncbi:FtsB family cell division protein [Streptacidiphilus monticola]|uniref:Septum formation initiator family protein n=1 Tax=Streptacidiphilus monticola TaxID=2161674 RepID=A0ABW1G2M8_9ACTN